MAKKFKVPRKRLVVVAGIMVPGVLAASTVAATNADAATTPLQVTLYACGTGSSAVWNSTPDPVLTAGTASPGTCGAPAGSTYNPANARLGFNGTFDSAVPATEPAFKASAYSTGTPRMVIGLLNGKTLGASGHGDRLLLRSGGPPRLHRHVHAVHRQERLPHPGCPPRRGLLRELATSTPCPGPPPRFRAGFDPRHERD